MPVRQARGINQLRLATEWGFRNPSTPKLNWLMTRFECSRRLQRTPHVLGVLFKMEMSPALVSLTTRHAISTMAAESVDCSGSSFDFFRSQRLREAQNRLQMPCRTVTAFFLLLAVSN